MRDVQIEESWKALLFNEFEQPYFAHLRETLRRLKSSGVMIYPPGPQIFAAFDHTPVDSVKVVILGQDPYHNPGEAMGLSFSVPRGIATPPSLRTIYQELADDVGFKHVHHGDLTTWARQGVLLLNTSLTVVKNQPQSHSKIGWQFFTDAVISQLSKNRSHLVFMLWGNHARSKASLVDRDRHLILEAAHPSPLARGAFLGCKHFSQANSYLTRHNRTPIDWQLPD